MKKLLAILLALAMLLSMTTVFTACEDDSNYSDEDEGDEEETEDTDGEETEDTDEVETEDPDEDKTTDPDEDNATDPEDTQPTQEETEPTESPYVPDPDREFVVNEAELEYTLTDKDVDTFYSLLEDFENLAMESSNEDAVMDSIEAMDAQISLLQAQASISMVQYYSNLKDEDASELYLANVEMLTQLEDSYMAAYRRIYEAGVPTKDAIFADWSELDILMLRNYSSEIMELEQRNSEIEVAYQDLQGDDELYDEMVPLYLEMVENNNRIAQIYGYENYYEYAYEVEYNRDYDKKEIEKMRGYVAEYIAPAIEDAGSNFYNGLYAMDAQDLYALNDFLEKSYDKLDEDYVQNYLDSLPLYTRDAMLSMFDGDILMLDNQKNAMEGAFTSTIGDDRCICFFGPGYSDALTIVHEAGHYYGGQYADLNSIPLDLAETQSQGNEWLMMRYLEGEMSEEIYQSLLSYQLYNGAATIMICVLVDEFEQQVYSRPDPSSLTGEDLDAIMEEICEAYGGIDYIETNATDIQYYWRMVVVEQPVYYISYAVSAIAAIDLYTVSEDGYDEAIQIYVNLIENLDPETGFLGNLKAAGLSGPFDEDVYIALYELLSE